MPLGTDVTAQLDQLAELASAGAWREAHRGLADWTARATSLLDDSKRMAAENLAPIEERNQLRGLLDAYRAKAAKHGLAENRELARIFGRAQTTLYTAPTDLNHARELVLLCQARLLSHQHDGGGASS
jgi:hypothetical protein